MAMTSKPVIMTSKVCIGNPMLPPKSRSNESNLNSFQKTSIKDRAIPPMMAIVQTSRARSVAAWPNKKVFNPAWRASGFCCKKVSSSRPKPKKTELAQVTPKPKPKPKAESKAKAKPSPSVLPTPKPVNRPDRKKPAPTVKPAKANDAVANQLNKLVKDQKKREQAASGVLQNLAEAQLAAKDAEKARKTQERKEAADTVTKTLSAVAGNAVKAPEKKSLSPVGIDDIARIQQHVSKCWQPPLGAAGNDTLKVDIFVSVDERGNVKRAEIEDKLRFNLDSYFKASAIAAKRAIVECSPLPIPPEKFDQLKEFTFSFDPAFLSR